MTDILVEHATTVSHNVTSHQIKENTMPNRTAVKALRTYNVAHWGGGYFDVNELGHVTVCPNPEVPQARVDLAD
ncbi:MAG: arginine decarboxylase, partial [Plesiomonas sp.]